MRELTVAEILRRVQDLQLTARRSVTEWFAGEYKSVFRGQGMEFDEVRLYQPGDEIRSIDWNVTARSGECFVKRYSEERELTVLFLFDLSASGFLGTTGRSKWDVAIEAAAIVLYSALRNGDRVGLVTFAADVLDYLPPRKGKSQTLRLIRHLVGARLRSGATDLNAPLEFLNRVQKRRAVVFLVSDFLAPFPRRMLGITQRRHDLTALTVRDRRELELPDVGLVSLRDPETGAVWQVDTGSAQVRAAFARQSVERERQLSAELQKLGIDRLALDTQGNPGAALRRFFAVRGARPRIPR